MGLQSECFHIVQFQFKILQEFLLGKIAIVVVCKLRSNKKISVVVLCRKWVKFKIKLLFT